MKTLFKNIFLVIGTLGLLITPGCKKHLDVNEDPNNPPLNQASNSIVFPAAVMGTAGAVGGQLAILGGIWGQYFTQAATSNQYKTIDAYQLTGSDLNGGYNLLFTRGLKNFQYVVDSAKSQQNWDYYLMAATMKAYTTQVLVDLYDKIPYSEALQGLGKLNPKFDDGYSIYVALLAELTDALSKPLPN